MNKAFYRKVQDAKLGIDSVHETPAGKPRRVMRKILRKRLNRAINKIFKENDHAM